MEPLEDRMNLKLIPVIELEYPSQGVDIPEFGPYWEFPSEWRDFHDKTYKKAGFKDRFESFNQGSSFYEIEGISDGNLRKIVLDHTKELRNGEFDRDQSTPLFGGYVLEIDGESLFYPQCCGDLGDIQFWRNISIGQNSFYEGHPAPIVTFNKEEIIFDLSDSQLYEEFCPTPKKRTFQFKRDDLVKAIKVSELILETFANRIQVINSVDNLNLEKIEDLLIWENSNYL